MHRPQHRFAGYATYGLSALLIYGGWWAGNAINLSLAQLPVRELPQVPAKPSAMSSKSLYPIWVKLAPTSASKAENPKGNLDALFKKQEDKAAIALSKAPPVPEIAEIDYASVVKQLARLQSVADNGAVINDRFYAKGEAIDVLALASSGKPPLLPVLARVQHDSVSIKVGNKTVKLALPPAF